MQSVNYLELDKVRGGVSGWVIVGIAAAAVCLLLLWAVDGHVAARRIYLNNADAVAGAQED